MRHFLCCYYLLFLVFVLARARAGGIKNQVIASSKTRTLHEVCDLALLVPLPVGIIFVGG